MALGENESGQVLRLGEKLRLAGEIAGEEILEDAAVGRIGHGDVYGGVIGGEVEKVKDWLLPSCNATNSRRG